MDNKTYDTVNFAYNAIINFIDLQNITVKIFNGTSYASAIN